MPCANECFSATATLNMGFNLINLYMHELVLHSDTPSDQFRPPFNTEIIKDGMVSSEPLSADHINALSACLTAIDGIFATFLSMEVPSIRCLPVFNFVRIAYAVVVLMKMYFSASSAQSELGKVISKENMRVEYYLDALLEKFRLTAAEDKCRPAAKFLIVLAMLRSWFLKQGKNGNGSAGAGVGVGGAPPGETPLKPSATPPDGSTIPQPHHGMNTPLQVLSEVAMGREPSGGRKSIFKNIPGIRQTPQPLFHDSASPTGSATNTNNPSTISSGAEVDPAADMGTAGGTPFPPPWMSQQQGPPPPAGGPAMDLSRQHGRGLRSRGPWRRAGLAGHLRGRRQDDPQRALVQRHVPGPARPKLLSVLSHDLLLAFSYPLLVLVYLSFSGIGVGERPPQPLSLYKGKFRCGLLCVNVVLACTLLLCCPMLPHLKATVL